MVSLAGPMSSGRLMVISGPLPRPARSWAASPPGPDDKLGDLDAERVRLLLREIFTAAGGTHDDWDTYDRVMAEERRTAVLVAPERVYSSA